MASSYRNNAEPKRRPAKNPSNQEGLDRLWERYDKFSSNPSSNMIYTIRKAIKSLQACMDGITTVKEAKLLHGVGDALARVIVKSKDNAGKTPGPSSTTTAATTATRIRARKPPPPPASIVGDCSIEAPALSEKQKAYNKAVANSKSLILPKDNWKVVLLVDGREHHSKKVIAKLQMSGIPSEERHLPIGDMAWVAKSGTCEVMLGTIIERKEVHDLALSLFGTRYNEQRLRLQNCGLSQVFLLVEGDTKDVSNCPHDTLQMACMETRIELGFQVVQTRHLEDTVRFLKSVHRRILQRAFPSAFGQTVTTSLPTFSSPTTARRKQKRRRRSIQKRSKQDRRSFEEMIFDDPPEPPPGASRFISYQELKCKVEKDREEGTKTINAIFCGMLKQIPKVSNATVQTLAQAYPTPDALFRALDGLNVVEGKNMLSDLTGAESKKVGEQKALQVYHTFMAGGNDDLVLEEHSSSPQKSAQPTTAKAVSKNRNKKVPSCSETAKLVNTDIPSFEMKENDYPAQLTDDNDVCAPPLSKHDSWDDLWQSLKKSERKAEISDSIVITSEQDYSNLDHKTQAKKNGAGFGVVNLLESDDEESTKSLLGVVSTNKPATTNDLSLDGREDSEPIIPKIVTKQQTILKEGTRSTRQMQKQYVTNNDLSLDESEDELQIIHKTTKQQQLLESGKNSTQKSRRFPIKNDVTNDLSLDDSEDEFPITKNTIMKQKKLSESKKEETKSPPQVPKQKAENNALTVEDSDDDVLIINTTTTKQQTVLAASESSISSWDVTPFVARRRQHQNVETTEFYMDTLVAKKCPTTDSGQKRKKDQNQEILEKMSTTHNNNLSCGHYLSLSSSAQPGAKKIRPSPASESSISSWDVTPFVEQRRRDRVYQDSSVDLLVQTRENTTSPYKTVTREVSISDNDSNATSTSPEVIELLD